MLSLNIAFRSILVFGILSIIILILQLTDHKYSNNLKFNENEIDERKMERSYNVNSWHSDLKINKIEFIFR